MLTETKFTPSDAPMAKMLSVILIFGQMLLVIVMLIPSDFRTDFIADLPASLEPSTLAGRCLATAVVALGWFFVLHLLRRVVRAVIHGDPFLPENVSRLRTIWIVIAATEIFRMIALFFTGGPNDGLGFRHGAALRAEQELTI